eukprot:5815327-Alexandrium_andersonii.AAC.1
MGRGKGQQGRRGQRDQVPRPERPPKPDPLFAAASRALAARPDGPPPSKQRPATTKAWEWRCSCP